jgi:hypothetical protein
MVAGFTCVGAGNVMTAEIFVLLHDVLSGGQFDMVTFDSKVLRERPSTHLDAYTLLGLRADTCVHPIEAV